jgi:glycosyltransferase involved in cell wall biosynthesis
MHILLIADGRSPITQRWIAMLGSLQARVSLVTTYPCQPIPGAELVGVMPVAFARFSGSQAGGTAPASSRKGLVSRIRPLAAQLRHWLGPWTLPIYERRFTDLVRELCPDIVHALRLPFEGMLAAATPRDIPLIVSTWGNDLTLHAPASPRMRKLTQRTLRRADALFSDTPRDAALAVQWGFDEHKPRLVVPGNGGLDLTEFDAAIRGISRALPPQIIDPRGLRAYVRSDTFFQAIPLVLQKYPQVHFLCASMQGQKEAQEWVKKLGIEQNVTLLPLLSQTQLWQEFARATASVSLSTHDGTPNSLLEAMAAGCLPICGDIDSIRDWIKPDENGLLIRPDDPKILAEAILNAIENAPLRHRAAHFNRQIIEKRASLSRTRDQIFAFYSQFHTQK